MRKTINRENGQFNDKETNRIKEYAEEITKQFYKNFSEYDTADLFLILVSAAMWERCLEIIDNNHTESEDKE